MKIVEVMCPARITLFVNNLGYVKNNVPKFKLVNQTINLYDRLEIKEDRKKHDGIVINSNIASIPLNENNICYKACLIFFEYTGINPSTMNIFLEKNIPVSMGFASSASDAAGMLIALDRFYKTALSKRELFFLGLQLGYEVPYFIISGYAYIKGAADNVERLHEMNPYQSYFIITPNFTIDKSELKNGATNSLIIEKSRHDDFLHNDYEKNMPNEVLRLKHFIESRSFTDYSLLGSGPSYFIPSENVTMPSRLIKTFHEEFPEYGLHYCKNTTSHKVLTKYL